MTAPTTVHLVRHGEVHNPANIRYGQLPGYGLSRRGEAQAREAGRYLREGRAPIAALISSPLERAVSTATLVQLELGLAGFDRDERLIEPPNVFDGLDRRAPLYPWNWPRLRDPFLPSWAEPFAAVAHRMRAAIAARTAAHPGGAIALVSHQSPIWLARLALAGLRGPPWLHRVRCGHASITTFVLDGERVIEEHYWAPR